MVYVSPEKKVLPAAGDTYDYTNEQKKFAASIRDIVSVANRAEADTIASQMGTELRPVSDANPLYVFNNETKNVEIKDGSGWRPMISTAPMGHMGLTSGFQNIVGGAGGKLTFDAAQILRGGITFNNATDSLVVPYTGLYRFNVRVLATGGGTPWVAQAWLTQNSAQTGIYTYFTKADGRDYTDAASGIMSLSAGDAMGVWMSYSGGAGTPSSYGTTGYNGTYLELEMIGV